MPTHHSYIISPYARPARSVVLRADELTIGVYSRFSMGWGEFSDEASAAFSLKLSRQLLKDPFASGESCSDCAMAAFNEVAAIAETHEGSVPVWFSAEFAAISLDRHRATMYWIGDVHGAVTFAGHTLANIKPHVAPFKDGSIIAKCLPANRDESVEAKAVDLPVRSTGVFAYVGSHVLTDQLEHDVRRAVYSTTADLVTEAEAAQISIAETHGVCVTQ